MIQTSNAGFINFVVDVGGAGGVTSVFGRTGAVVAQNGDYSSGQITNASGVPGANVGAALDSLGPAVARTVGNLPDADTTIGSPHNEQRLLASTLTASRTLTITPSTTNGRAQPIDVGTQGFDYVIANGGPILGTYTVVAGNRERVWAVSDGVNVYFNAERIGQEPT